MWVGETACRPSEGFNVKDQVTSIIGYDHLDQDSEDQYHPSQVTVDVASMDIFRWTRFVEVKIIGRGEARDS